MSYEKIGLATVAVTQDLLSGMPLVLLKKNSSAFGTVYYLNSRILIPFSVSLWNDLSDPVFDGVGLSRFKSRVNVSLFTYLLTHFLSPPVFPFSSFILWVGIVGMGSSD